MKRPIIITPHDEFFSNRDTIRSIHVQREVVHSCAVCSVSLYEFGVCMWVMSSHHSIGMTFWQWFRRIDSVVAFILSVCMRKTRTVLCTTNNYTKKKDFSDFLVKRKRNRIEAHRKKQKKTHCRFNSISI